MNENPYQSPEAQSSSNAEPMPDDGGKNALAKPVLAYTANGNQEAHSVVTWLESNGVCSYAVEDNAGASLFAFGAISQFHKPQVFVEASQLKLASELLQQFELQRQQRRSKQGDSEPIASECEECGIESEFPASQEGTTQNCPKCKAYMDVGAFDWPEDFDFGTADSMAEDPANPEDAMDAAIRLEKNGDWDAAISVFRDIADRWPQHATYAANCIIDLQRKIDGAQS